MKKYIYILIAMMTFVLSSCNKEDDINEIFVGKTWYVIGYTINNTDAPQSDLGALFNNGSGCYYFSFKANRFTACLSDGRTFSGSWVANGKNKSLTLTIDNAPSIANALDKTLYGIIEKACAYEGDANLMNIKDNNSNKVRLSVKR